MSGGLFITSTEARSGKSLISLGMMEMLIRNINRIGFFRPFIDVDPEFKCPDNDIDLISSHFNLPAPYETMYAYPTAEAIDLMSSGRESDVIEGVIRKYNELKQTCDFVLCEGTDFSSASAVFELDINAEVCKNLGIPVLLVANAHDKTVEDTFRAIELALESLEEKGCHTIATIINRTKPEDNRCFVEGLNRNALVSKQLVYSIPDEPSLGNPTIGEIASILGAEVLFGKEELTRHVKGFTIAAMQLRNFLDRIEHGSLVITPGDRDDVIIACLSAASSLSMENIAGILLTGGLKPEGPVWELIKGFPRPIPVLSVKQNTYPTATLVDRIHAVIDPADKRKITQALAVFERNVKVDELSSAIITTRTTVVTPKMFEFELLQKARIHKQHIVLPEGQDERILRAAETIVSRDVADITLLGNRQQIEENIAQLGLKLDSASIISPEKSGVFEEYSKTFYELRKHRGITLEHARDIMCDVNYFGTMMILKGHAHGMVSGSTHSTADTVRPAFEIIKTRPGFTVVSSVFMMCLADRVLVYGDCAVNPNPDAGQLAEIALSSARTAVTFGIEPIVAMLSYSTGESGTGEDVKKIREATGIARQMAAESFPEIEIDGPIQYDAAVDPDVAKAKMPDSRVAGRATVFIFPDLNTGNNTYKAVQRSSGAVAVGPVLQGLKYPVNDLSRGCTVSDIVNTIAITAVQAQSEKS